MIRPALRNSTVAIALGSFAWILVSGPALAQQSVETDIRNWVAAIDASPQWVAGIGEMTVDATTNTVTIHNLSVRSETPWIIPDAKVEITFDRIDMTGFAQQPDGAFKIDALRFGDLRITGAGKTTFQASTNPDETKGAQAGEIDMRIASGDLKNLSVPSIAAVPFDPAKPVLSWIRTAAVLSKTSLDSATLSDLAWDQTFQGEKSHTTFRSYALLGMKDGRIDRQTIQDVEQESPSPDGLVKMKVETVEGRGYDANAMFDILDPDRYVGGVGDGKWRTAQALETYRNWSFVLPGVEMRIGAFETENFKLRQPPKPFTPVFDELIANPNMDEKQMASLLLDAMPDALYAFGVGAFRMTDLDVIAPEIQRMHLGDFHLTDFSADGLGEIGIGDLDVSVDDKGSFGAERIAVGGFLFPSLEKIKAAIRASQADLEVDPLPLIPTMGYAEAVNLDLVQTGKKLGAVDRARLDLTDYIGPVPTSVALDLRGLDLDLSLVDDPKARQMIESLGYDRLQAEYGFKLHWREADESLNLNDFKLAIKDVGSISADIALAGLKRATIENPTMLESALPNLLFSRGKIVVKDGSVVDRAIAMEAKKKNQTPEKFREDVAGALPLTLMLVLKNPTFQQKLAPALQTFLRTPGTLTLTAAPATPVPVLAIMAAAQNDPRSLPNLISMEVKAGQ